MADTVTISASLTGKVDTLTTGLTFASLAHDLGTPAESDASVTTLSTAYADLNFDEVAWNEATWAMFKNLSSTTGEDITVAAVPVMNDGLTDEGTVAGGSVPATLSAAGDFQMISAAGTSQGIDWEVGDIAVYLGSSGVWGRISPGPFALLKPGKFALFQVQTNSTTSFKFKSAAGAPRIAHSVVGALA